MTELTAQAIVVLLIGGVTVAVWFYAIPAMGRLSCLYYLHNRRDELFLIAESRPEYRQTLIFRDLDALLAGAIHVLRDGSELDTVMFYKTMVEAKESGGSSGSKSWRAKQMQFELENTYDDATKEHLQTLLSIPEVTTRVVGIRMILMHPLPLILTILAVQLVLIRSLCAFAGRGFRSVVRTTELSAAHISLSLEHFGSPPSIQRPERIEVPFLIARNLKGRAVV